MSSTNRSSFNMNSYKQNKCMLTNIAQLSCGNSKFPCWQNLHFKSPTLLDSACTWHSKADVGITTSFPFSVGAILTVFEIFLLCWNSSLDNSFSLVIKSPFLDLDSNDCLFDFKSLLFLPTCIGLTLLKSSSDLVLGFPLLCHFLSRRLSPLVSDKFYNKISKYVYDTITNIFAYYVKHNLWSWLLHCIYE